MCVSLIQSIENLNRTKTGLPSNARAKKEFCQQTAFGLELQLFPGAPTGDLGLTKPP